MSKQDLKSFDVIRLAGVVRESIVDGPGLDLQYFVRDVRMDVKSVIIRKLMILKADMIVIFQR